MKYILQKIDQYTVQHARKTLQEAVAKTIPDPHTKKQLLVDVSTISMHDAGTGIQRVVRGVLEQLVASPPEGYVVKFVASMRRKPYQFIQWNMHGTPVVIKNKIIVQAGDIFLGLDFCTHAVVRHYCQLAKWKRQGGKFHFIIHDLLPAHHPEWFSDKSVSIYRRWIKKTIILTDSVVCFSQAVKTDFYAWCKEQYYLLPGSIPVHVIPMGWISAETRSWGVPSGFKKKLSRISAQNSALMVGTIEPRKGHEQVLDAFEYLWKQGKNHILVIVGRPGWKMEAFQQRLREHLEYNHCLFWFDDASDEALHALYDTCNGVIVASYAEGFGIPLIEALGHRKPVLARDLPVFRERAQQGIEYFNVHESKTLAGVIENWLASIPVEPVVPSGLYSWKESTVFLLKIILPTA